MNLKFLILTVIVIIFSVGRSPADPPPPLPNLDPPLPQNSSRDSLNSDIPYSASTPPTISSKQNSATQGAQEDDSEPFLDLGTEKLPSVDSTTDIPEALPELPDLDNMPLNSNNLLPKNNTSPKADVSDNQLELNPSSKSEILAPPQQVAPNQEEIIVPSLPDDNIKQPKVLPKRDLPAVVDIKAPIEVPRINEQTITIPETDTKNNDQDKQIATPLPIPNEVDNTGNITSNIENSATGSKNLEPVTPISPNFSGHLESSTDNTAAETITNNEDTTQLIANEETNQDQQETISIETFIANEAKMLLLPNDDLVLGEPTSENRFAEMDFLSYAQASRKYYRNPIISKRLEEFQNFIDTYYSGMNKDITLSQTMAKNAAFNAVESNDLNALRVLADNYNLLQSLDDRGNNLLHFAVSMDNYPLVKYLMIKGINLSSINYSAITPEDIARKQSYNNILLLLLKNKITN